MNLKEYFKEQQMEMYKYNSIEDYLKAMKDERTFLLKEKYVESMEDFYNAFGVGGVEIGDKMYLECIVLKGIDYKGDEQLELTLYQLYDEWNLSKAIVNNFGELAKKPKQENEDPIVYEKEMCDICKHNYSYANGLCKVCLEGSRWIP